ncbi:conserved hypothetical protein [Xanthomonas citri pv. citri]|nr:conserved hypothetical protein [Xanthomonas citri pv. citri]
MARKWWAQCAASIRRPATTSTTPNATSMRWRFPTPTSARYSKAMRGGCTHGWMRNCAHVGCDPLLPQGEGARRADEGTGEASCTQNNCVGFAPYPHPNPSPEGRGALSRTFVSLGLGWQPDSGNHTAIGAYTHQDHSPTPQTQTPGLRRVFAWMQIA